MWIGNGVLVTLLNFKLVEKLAGLENNNNELIIQIGSKQKDKNRTDCF